MKDAPAPDLKVLAKAATDDARNRLLLHWLADDDLRARLFDLVNQEAKGELEVPSRDARRRRWRSAPDDDDDRAPPTGHKRFVLVTSRARIEAILKENGNRFSNRLYAALGGGNFMLALDPAGLGKHAHEAQVKAYHDCFPNTLDAIARISRHACGSAAILSLRGPDFDLAEFAEQVALRFCMSLLGFPLRDFPRLEASLRALYRALVYQVLGRHFATEPMAIPSARRAIGELLERTAALLDAYARDDEDALAGCEPSGELAGLTPVLQALARYESELNGEQRAVIALGAAVGTVGNVQAAACIAVDHLFRHPNEMDKAVELVRRGRQVPAPDDRQMRMEWWALLLPALRANPPIPFLPRVEVADKYKDRGGEQEFILALGGGTRGDDAGDDDPLIWGLPKEGLHWCLGRELARVLVVDIVRQVLALPGIAEQLDPLTAQPVGLEKRWGFACERYPLTHRRDRRVAQSSLNVAMRVRSPVAEHAAAVRVVISAGAPRIEEALRESRHLHFAWFELIEGDTVLVLHTVYDGPFNAYIQHFAQRVGDLFDVLFEHIEDPPPMPVRKFANEFAAHIQRYNRAPTMGYFFSAYPRSEVAQIVRDEARRL